MFLRKIGKFAAASAIVVLGLVATAGTSFADFVVSASRPVVVADDVNNQITTVLSASSAGAPDCANGGMGLDGTSCSGLSDGSNPGQGNQGQPNNGANPGNPGADGINNPSDKDN